MSQLAGLPIQTSSLGYPSAMDALSRYPAAASGIAATSARPGEQGSRNSIPLDIPWL
jgi:hypothetical protein